MKESVRSNYLGTKFLLDNLKKDKQLILKTSNVLKSYSVQFLSKDVLYGYRIHHLLKMPPANLLTPRM